METRILNFNEFGDDRGCLISLESMKNIPFEIERVYYIYKTKSEVTRGYHAHRDLKQVAIALSGSCTFVLDDGLSRNEVILDDPTKGLLICSMIWREMKLFSDDCILLVLANHNYNEEDYIRDYSSFLKEVRNICN
ncbi:sugar 3,4-ketoisomerase [Pantoea wallisii]|uniref:sugar 3,4-ketoisomerase n=1 Tax=Pantoea wallisii TaxID=1076551 RepID=UPI000FFBF7C1|nr:FdtA/QdtA family cupin domain-containing protein [Pantoea wallisii]